MYIYDDVTNVPHGPDVRPPPVVRPGALSLTTAWWLLVSFLYRSAWPAAGSYLSCFVRDQTEQMLRHLTLILYVMFNPTGS